MEETVDDIICRVTRGELSPKDACMRLRGQAGSEDGRTAILDYIWLESLVESEEEKFRLQDLVAGLVQEGILLLEDVIASLEADVIPDEVCNADILKRKRTQAKTKRIYTVPKFNLLSECPEGYATIIDILWNVLKHGCAPEDASQIADKIRASIGMYQLCPTKTVSIIISLLSEGTHYAGSETLVSMIRLLANPERVSSVLIFHLLEESKEGNGPSGLSRVISLLSSHQLVDLGEIWSVMMPTMAALSEASSSLVNEYQRLLDAVSRTLAGGVGSPEEDQQQTSINDRVGKVFETFSTSLRDTQRFQLIAELVRTNQMDVAIPLMTHVQEQLGGQIPISAVDLVRDAILGHISSLENGAEVLRIMEFVGVFVGTDHVILAKIFRLIQTQITDPSSVVLLGKYILPSLSMGCPNPYICSLAWDCVCLLSPETRFATYRLWDQTYDSTFPLGIVKQEATNQTRSLLKRVVKGAQVGDTVSRNSHYQFAKLCCCNPLVVLKYVVSNIQIHFNYNLIEPYVEVTSKISQMAQDIVSFLISAGLETSRPSLNMKTASIEPWLSNLSEFTGRFLKKHPSTPLDALMGLISASMSSSEGKEFLKAAPARVLLEAIIEHMGDFSVVHQLNAEQIEAISGGPVLNSLVQAATIQTTNSNSAESVKLTDKAKAALKQALLGQPGLVQTIYHCLGSQLSDLTTSQQVAQELIKGGGLKLLGILYDGVHSCVLQLTEFLSQNCCDESEYRQCCLPFENPLVLFHSSIDVGMAFHVLRPGWSPDWTVKISSAVFPGSSSISPNLFGTFWRLSLSDIYVPLASYGKQSLLLKDRIAAQEVQIEKLEKSKDLPDSKDQLRTVRRELARLRDQSAKLEIEKEKHVERHERSMAEIRSEAGTWWTGVSSSIELISEMISKRVFVSIQDSIFCAHFVNLLIREKVPGFDLVDFFDQWTELLALTVTSSSEGEMKNLAEFIKDMMALVLQMRKDEALALRFFSNASELSASHSRWEGQIKNALKAGLNKDQADWCEKRNCLIMISKTCDVFPVIHVNAVDLIQSVKVLVDDPQEDIATLANALSRKLASFEANWLDKTISPSPAVQSPKEVEDTRMDEASEGGPTKQPVKERPNLDRKLEESPRKPPTVKRGTRDDQPETIVKRPRGGDDTEMNRERVTRSRARDQGPAPRQRDRGGNISRRRD